MDFFKALFKYTVFFFNIIPIAALADLTPLSSYHPYAVGLDVGVGETTNLGNSTSFPLGYSTFSYTPNARHVNAGIAGISLSKIFTLAPLYSAQIGFSAHVLSNMGAKGTLEQGISPPYYQANYFYNVKSYQYLADIKLGHAFYERYVPYLYAGLGLASNKAYGYSTNIPDYLTVTPEYKNKTTNSFTYSVGLGADYFVIPTCSVGIGYRFINLGKVGLGSGVIRTTNVDAQLKQSNLYLNSFLIQLNYFMG